jgi:hypothetical protein
VAQQRTLETVVHRGNLLERERETEVAGVKQRHHPWVWKRCRGGGVREIRLVEHMSGDEDTARGEVKATVPLVVKGVTEKHTMSGAGRQLVRSSGSGDRVTSAPEDTKVIVARRGTEESMVRSQSRGSSGKKMVEQVGGGVEALGPEVREQRGHGSEGCT